jgi:hypothetical protein
LTAITNPKTTKALIEDLNTEALIPANNLADIYDMPTALSNLGISKKTVTVTVTAVAGAANVSTVTVTSKDANGATVTGIQWYLLLTTSDAAGGTISATAYSGTLVAVTGTIPITYTAKHAFLVATDATGVFVGSLTDTAKTADFIAVLSPLGPSSVMSAAMAFG